VLLGGKLLSFAFRALILIILIPLLWLTVAERYNTALVAVAKNLVGDTPSLSVLGTRIMIEYSPTALPFSLDSLTLHSGLVLLSVLVLASVGEDILSRIRWLIAFITGAYILHVVGIALLTRGIVWSSGAADVEESTRLVLKLFAIFWGLIPALAGGAWAFGYWLPRMNAPPPETDPPTPNDPAQATDSQ
jgi:hypothetical protein